MRKRTLFFLFLCFLLRVTGQDCPTITNPQNGSIGVPVNSTITWNQVDGIVGYLISLGTTPGGVDLLNRRSAGPVNSFTPEVGLPEDTDIWVTISLFLPNQPLKICEVERFHTEDVTTPPGCTMLTTPANNETGVSTGTEIRWAYAEKATGYRISIGTTPGGTDITDDFDVGNVLSYQPPSGLPEDADVYVRITPYNENKPDPHFTCPDESFNTGMDLMTCNAYFDAVTGSMVEVRPLISFPAMIGLCRNNLPAVVSGENGADGYRWYRIEGDSETLISQEAEINISEEGMYLYEAYNLIDQGGTPVECANFQEFTAIFSEMPDIASVDLLRLSDGLEITVQVEGRGNYEYALDNGEGPYQDEPVFHGVPRGVHTVFVRDKNGCGTAMKLVDRELSKDDFPKFFTPNGDGINDYWQIQPSSKEKTITLEYLRIFDRYGTLLAQVTPSSPGWDGNFNGRPLPSTVYWFRAADNLQNIVQGYFMLKR